MLAIIHPQHLTIAPAEHQECGAMQHVYEAQLNDVGQRRVVGYRE